MFNAHPQKPSDSRIEELGYPWVEGEMFKPVGMRPVNAGGVPFTVRFAFALICSLDLVHHSTISSSNGLD